MGVYAIRPAPIFLSSLPSASIRIAHISCIDARLRNAASSERERRGIGLKVGTDGIPREIHVIHSAAEGVKPKLRKAAASLDEKALDAVRQYRFDPATYHGKPVPVAITIDVSFHIYPDK